MLVDHIPAILWTTDLNLVITHAAAPESGPGFSAEEDINGQSIEAIFRMIPIYLAFNHLSYRLAEKLKSV